MDLDILVSNSCTFIISFREIKKENQLFINIHPSLLPSYRESCNDFKKCFRKIDRGG